jgi:hypothetical protein
LRLAAWEARFNDPLALFGVLRIQFTPEPGSGLLRGVGALLVLGLARRCS